MAYQLNDGPLAHLAAPENNIYAQLRYAVMCTELYRSLMYCRQVHRPHNPFSASWVPPFISDTRSTHSTAVTYIADDLANCLGLNRDLCDLGATAHDFGHLSKGHFGEQWVSKHFARPFKHEYFSLVILEDIEGFVLPREAEQTIAFHSWDSGVMTRPDLSEECRVVALADKIAWVVGDAFDARELLWHGGLNHLPFVEPERSQLLSELDEYLVHLDPDFRPFDYQPLNFYLSGPIFYDQIPAPKELGLAEISSIGFRMKRQITQAAVIESAFVGRVQFEQSSVVKPFLKLKDWLDRHIYHLIDDQPKETRELEGAFAYLAEEYPGIDSLPLFLCLNDLLVRRAAALAGAVPGIDGFLDDDEFEFRMDIEEELGSVIRRLRQPLPIDPFKVPMWI